MAVSVAAGEALDRYLAEDRVATTGSLTTLDTAAYELEVVTAIDTAVDAFRATLLERGALVGAGATDAAAVLGGVDRRKAFEAPGVAIRPSLGVRMIPWGM